MNTHSLIETHNISTNYDPTASDQAISFDHLQNFRANRLGYLERLDFHKAFIRILSKGDRAYIDVPFLEITINGTKSSWILESTESDRLVFKSGEHQLTALARKPQKEAEAGILERHPLNKAFVFCIDNSSKHYYFPIAFEF